MSDLLTAWPQHNHLGRDSALLGASWTTAAPFLAPTPPSPRGASASSAGAEAHTAGPSGTLLGLYATGSYLSPPPTSLPDSSPAMPRKPLLLLMTSLVLRKRRHGAEKNQYYSEYNLHSDRRLYDLRQDAFFTYPLPTGNLGGFTKPTAAEQTHICEMNKEENSTLEEAGLLHFKTTH